MNSTRFYQRLEIAFWDTFINFVTDSPRFRAFAPEVYLWIKKVDRISYPILGLVLGALGLGVGFLLGFLAIVMN